MSISGFPGKSRICLVRPVLRSHRTDGFRGDCLDQADVVVKHSRGRKRVRPRLVFGGISRFYGW